LTESSATPKGDRARSRRLAIPLPEAVRSTLRVHLRAETPPDLAALAPVARGLVAAMPPGAFRDALAEVLARDALELRVLTPEQAGAPDIETLRRSGLGPRREAALRDANCVLEVAALDRVDGAPEGLSLVEVAACGLAERLGGVVVDPHAERALGRSACHRFRRGARRPFIAERVRIVAGASDRARETVATVGMAKFGLPDLLLDPAPAELAEPAGALLLGLAHVLLRLLNEQAGLRRTPLPFLETPAEVRVAREDVVHAGRPEATRGAPGSEGWARVGLSFEADGGGRTVLRVGAPAGEAAGWLARALSDLLGPCSAPAEAAAPAGDAGAATALPLADACERFLAGREAGATLRVLVAFPTTDGGAEPLWVAVDTWERPLFEGVLCDHPHRRRDLAPGRRVTVHETHALSWRLRHPDGREEAGAPPEASRPPAVTEEEQGAEER